MIFTMKAHFAFRSVCFARGGIESSCVCESRSPRLISGGLRAPYPALFQCPFADSPVKNGDHLFLIVK